MDRHEPMMAWMAQDYPIFTESIRRIGRSGDTALPPLQQQVLEQLVHSSGDLSIGSLLEISDEACERGVNALQQGAPILTDTAMAAAAVAPMARRTLGMRCTRCWVGSGAGAAGVNAHSRRNGAGLAHARGGVTASVGADRQCADRPRGAVAAGGRVPQPQPGDRHAGGVCGGGGKQEESS